MDDIFAAWMYNERERWYEVLVFEIEVQDTRPVVAKGVIEYIEGLAHRSEVQTVVFILYNKN